MDEAAATANLIDLSIGDNDDNTQPDNDVNSIQNDDNHSINIGCTTDLFASASAAAAATAPSSESGRDSLDNNPFDCLQKIVTKRRDDPFDIIEKEASLMPSQRNISHEIETANLINLTDEDKTKNRFFGDSDSIKSGQSRHSSLENESPPAYMLDGKIKGTPESSDSSQLNSISPFLNVSGGTSMKSKVLENRKRLLKLSISNAACLTPPTSHVKLPDIMLSDESPIKLVGDDFMSEEPPITNKTDSDFEADLQKLNFNNSLTGNKTPNYEEPQEMPESKHCQTYVSNKAADVSTVGPLPDLEKLRLKLRQKREEPHSSNTNSQDILSLVGSLRTLINAAELGGKNSEAESLLDTLTKALQNNDEKNRKQESGEENTESDSPRPFVRQGTFDIELEEGKNPTANVSNETVDMVATAGQPMEDIPDLMLRSSATYDGENLPPNPDIELPEIEPLSPTQPNVNIIMEQLHQLLEQIQGTTNESSACSDSGNSSMATSASNPTFIVVMPATPTVHNSQLTQHLQQSFMEDSFDAGSSAMRRRSQSLSIHDKIRIVKWPMLPPPARSEDLSPESPVYEFQTPAKAPPVSSEIIEIKASVRQPQRRYSFNNGAPHTPKRTATNSSNFSSMSARRSINTLASSTSIKSPSRSTISRRSSLAKSETIDGPSGSQHKKINLPPSLSTLKQSKPRSGESVLRSSAPLKATVPIKNFAYPTSKISPVTPLKKNAPRLFHSNSSLANTSMLNKSLANDSIQLSLKSGPISQTSTPVVPSKRTSGRVGRELPTTPISKTYQQRSTLNQSQTTQLPSGSSTSRINAATRTTNPTGTRPKAYPSKQWKPSGNNVRNKENQQF